MAVTAELELIEREWGELNGNFGESLLTEYHPLKTGQMALLQSW